MPQLRHGLGLDLPDPLTGDPVGLADLVQGPGERVVDPALAAESLATGQSPLAAWERDVLVAAKQGSSVPEIARKLLTSEGTVRNHRHWTQRYAKLAP